MPGSFYALKPPPWRQAKWDNGIVNKAVFSARWAPCKALSPHPRHRAGSRVFSDWHPALQAAAGLMPGQPQLVTLTVWRPGSSDKPPKTLLATVEEYRVPPGSTVENTEATQVTSSHLASEEEAAHSGFGFGVDALGKAAVVRVLVSVYSLPKATLQVTIG